MYDDFETRWGYLLEMLMVSSPLVLRAPPPQQQPRKRNTKGCANLHQRGDAGDHLLSVSRGNGGLGSLARSTN